VTAEEIQSQAEGEQSQRNYFYGVRLIFRPVLIAVVPADAPAADLVARLEKRAKP